MGTICMRVEAMANDRSRSKSRSFVRLLLPEWSTAVCLFSDSCSWVPCLSWTVQLPAVLQKIPSGPTNDLVSQHFCVFEPFPTLTVWFWDQTFHIDDNRWTHLQILQKIQTLLNRMKMFIFFLFCLNSIFFHLVLPSISYKRYLHVFQRTN